MAITVQLTTFLIFHSNKLQIITYFAKLQSKTKFYFAKLQSKTGTAAVSICRDNLLESHERIVFIYSYLLIYLFWLAVVFFFSIVSKELAKIKRAGFFIWILFTGNVALCVSVPVCVCVRVHTV